MGRTFWYLTTEVISPAMVFKATMCEGRSCGFKNQVNRERDYSQIDYGKKTLVVLCLASRSNQRNSENPWPIPSQDNDVGLAR